MRKEANRKKLIAVIGSAKLQAGCDEYGAVFLDEAIDPVPITNRPKLWELAAASIDGEEIPIYVRRGEGEHEYVVYIRGEVINVELETERDRRLKTLSKSAAGRRSAGQMVRAPMPGLLKAVLVAEGTVVHKGEPLCILEAMKMENEIKSPGEFAVKRVHAEAGNAVDKGAVLVELVTVDGQAG